MRVQRVLLSPLRVKAQHIAQEIRTDIRFGHTVPVEADSLRTQIIVAVRQSRNEMSAESPYICLSHLPDTEEAEDMIHTVSVEIVLHLLEALPPPSEVILRHLVPVIRRESPVLPADGEVIRRSAGTGVEVE